MNAALQPLAPVAVPVAPRAGGRMLEWLTWLVATMAAGGLVAAAWTWGMGVAPDGVTYIEAAAQLVKGRGLVPHPDGSALLSAHYPPLYPLVLAGLFLVSEDLVRAATWLHAALLAVNIVLVARLTARAADGAVLVPLAAATVLAANLPFLEAHGWIASEALFLSCMLGALLLLVDALPLEGRSRRRGLAWAALATAAACLTRYAGLALLGAGAVAVVLWAHGPRRQRLTDAITFALIAAAPLGLWLLRNHVLFETAANRTASLLGLPPEQVARLRLTIVHWFVPWPLERLPLLAAVAVAIVGAACVAAWRIFAAGSSATALQPGAPAPRGGSPVRVVRRVLLLFAVCYALLAFATVLFLDPTTLLDTRLFLPLQIALLVLVVAVVGNFVARRDVPLAWAAATGVLLLLITVNAWASMTRTVHVARSGRGFTSRTWTRSATLRHAAAVPFQTPLYSNSHEPIRLHLGRPATLLPRANEWAHTKSAATYEQTLNDFARRLRWQDAVVVWFKRSHRNGRYEPEADLMRKLGLVRLARMHDGAIYAPAQPPTSAPTTTVTEAMPGGGR